ncbi:MAG: hypothetical protein MUF31_05555 [Akkermansiaceae bacterium]|nr:hypothetical protein [Akkermansiaceae bacterium]
MSPQRMASICMVFSAVLVFSGCRHESANPLSGFQAQAQQFKSEWVDAISIADEVHLIEHSWLYDFRDQEGEFLDDPKTIEYKRVNLSSSQRALLIKAIEEMSEAPKTETSLCAFEPHHSIELLYRGGTKGLIQVCFKCRDIEWDGNRVIPPADCFDVLQRYIETLGYQADRDWVELARAHRLDASTSQPANGSESLSIEP